MQFFLPTLTLILITLKLIGYIAISWIWVLSPVWIPFVTMLALSILLVATGSKYVNGEWV